MQLFCAFRRHVHPKQEKGGGKTGILTAQNSKKFQQKNCIVHGKFNSWQNVNSDKKTIFFLGIFDCLGQSKFPFPPFFFPFWVNPPSSSTKVWYFNAFIVQNQQKKKPFTGVSYDEQKKTVARNTFFVYFCSSLIFSHAIKKRGARWMILVWLNF